MGDPFILSPSRIWCRTCESLYSTALASGIRHEDQTIQFTLWAIARAPLILGANLTELDKSILRLIANRAVIRINQTAWASHPIALPAGFENYRVWEALAGRRAQPTRYIAIFNLDEKPAHLSAQWAQLGLRDRHAVRDLWNGEVRPTSSELSVDLPAHGSALFRVE
jgi:alpha-galactosidase